MISIRQGETAPPDAFAATRYRERWFWIDDNDVRSKGVFSFMTFMFALTETGETQSRAARRDRAGALGNAWPWALLAPTP